MTSQDHECWKPVPGYEGFYEVSSIGRVKSLARPRSPRGQARRERILRATPLGAGYLAVGLSIDQRHKPQLVHRLVLLAFVGPCPSGMQACHNDGNPQNNVLTNLRWDSLAANQADRVRHGTAFTRANHPRAKLRPDGVTRAIALREEGKTFQAIGDLLGVSRRAVSMAIQQAKRDGTTQNS